MRDSQDFGWSDCAALAVSGVAAALAPLQVFLLAYAVLGPFHYLTEIAWLRKKDFYFREGPISPRSYLLLATAMSVLAVTQFIVKRGFGFWVVGALLLLSLTIWVRNRYTIAAIAVAGLVAARFLHAWVFFIAIIVPTLVHVFFFTWTFMVSGALRNKRSTLLKWINPALLLLIPVALAELPMHYANPGSFWLRGEAGSFAGLHKRLALDLHHTLALNSGLLHDPVIAALLRLFAFVYLFHYLNWFAKTELLQWHKISRRGWAAIAMLYVASVGVYLWNFRVGFIVSSFLSMLHVLLEFPLNWHTLRFVALRLLGKDAGVGVASAQEAPMAVEPTTEVV